MNEKVAKLINDEKARLSALEKEKRDEHLISLGLIDKTKTRREYLNYYSSGAKEDLEKGYYLEKPGAQEVTKEEYEEICKYFPLYSKKIVKTDYKNGGFQTLNGFAKAFYVCSVAAALVALISFFGYYSEDRLYEFTKLIIAGYSLLVTFISLLSGAICQGLSIVVKTAFYQKTLLEKEYKFVA